MLALLDVEYPRGIPMGERNIALRLIILLSAGVINVSILHGRETTRTLLIGYFAVSRQRCQYDQRAHHSILDRLPWDHHALERETPFDCRASWERAHPSIAVHRREHALRLPCIIGVSTPFDWLGSPCIVDGIPVMGERDRIGESTPFDRIGESAPFDSRGREGSHWREHTLRSPCIVDGIAVGERDRR
jgi:hypothetical protein